MFSSARELSLAEFTGENAMATKTPNYTEAMISEIRERYTAVRDSDQTMRDSVVRQIAADLGKSWKGIIAKLAPMVMETEAGEVEKLYRPKEKVSSVTGGSPAKKDALAAQFVKMVGLNLVSAEKLNKTDLSALIVYVESVNTMAARYNDMLEYLGQDVETSE